MPYALCTQVFPIYCGREARHLRSAWTGQAGVGWHPGPKELLLSRHNPFVSSLSEWLPSSSIPHLFLCIRLVFSPGCFVADPPPPYFFFATPSPFSPFITLCASVSIPCYPASLCLLVPLPAFCPSHSKTAVSLCRRSGGPGAEEEGCREFPPTPLPLTQLKPWVWGGGGVQTNKTKNTKQKTPKKGLLLFAFEGEISEM